LGGETSREKNATDPRKGGGKNAGTGKDRTQDVSSGPKPSSRKALEDQPRKTERGAGGERRGKKETALGGKTLGLKCEVGKNA